VALAERARRDVEALGALSAVATDDQDAAQAAGPSRPPEIQWIRARPDADPPAPAPAAAQTPLAREAALPAGPLPPEVAETAEERTFGPSGEDRLRGLIVELSGELYRRAAYSDMPLRELLLIAATTMVTPDRPLAPDALPGLTERERELLASMQAYFTRLGRELATTGDAETVVAAAAALHRSLADEPRLQLANASLCTRVGGFGDYDEFARNDAGRYAFLAHSGQQAVVYVEVEDFTSELNDKGQWMTELSQQLVVYSDRDGIPVWREDWQAGVDATKNRREDFFIVQVITLAERLSVGRYQLKIHIRDEKSGAEAENAIDFEMVADPRMAARGRD
jgi:hypothetical protein